MILAQASISFRTDSPEIIELGVDSVLTLAPSASGVLLTPDSATVSVYDATGAAIVEDATADCADGLAVYTVTAATTTGLAPSDGWSVVWRARMPDEEVDRTIRTTAVLALVRLYPPCSDADLYQRCPSLDAKQKGSVAPNFPQYSGFLADAWSQLHNRLIEENRAPWLLASSAPLREAHLTLTLALILESFSTKQSTFLEQSRDYRRQFEAAYTRARVPMKSAAGTAVGEPSTARTGLRAPIFIGGRVP